MSDALNMQYELPEVPDEEKASAISIALCHKSHASYFACYVK